MDTNNAEFIEMMNRCKHEIVALRETVDRLQPKAEAYDNLAAVLRLLPRTSVGMSEQCHGHATRDELVWRLDKRIQELAPKPKPTEASEKVS